jgi:hypothetical protein
MTKIALGMWLRANFIPPEADKIHRMVTLCLTSRAVGLFEHYFKKVRSYRKDWIVSIILIN